MANSDVEIVNSALIKIGEDTISSLNEDRKAARRANQQFPLKRRQLIRSYRWNFAVKRTQLASVAPDPADGTFAKNFNLPADSIKIVGLVDDRELQTNYTASKLPFKVENGKILADDDPINVVYVADVTDPALFDPTFDEALAWFLAIDLAYALSTGSQQLRLAREGFRDAIKMAKLADAIEGTPEVVESSEWIDSRMAETGFPPRIGPVII